MKALAYFLITIGLISLAFAIYLGGVLVWGDWTNRQESELLGRIIYHAIVGVLVAGGGAAILDEYYWEDDDGGL
jgi:hypothetical protein